MYFSGYQWIAAIILDVFLRALFFAVSQSLFVLFAPFISIIHYAFLGTVSGLMTAQNIRARFSIPFTVLIVNILFFGAFVGALAALTKAGQATSCLAETNQCYWINGTISELGIRALVQRGIEQIVVNLIPILIVWPFGIGSTQGSNDP